MPVFKNESSRILSAKAFQASRIIENLLPSLIQCPKCENAVDVRAMKEIPNFGLACPNCVRDN